jgi:hypothetical protein
VPQAGIFHTIRWPTERALMRINRGRRYLCALGEAEMAAAPETSALAGDGEEGARLYFEDFVNGCVRGASHTLFP